MIHFDQAHPSHLKQSRPFYERVLCKQPYVGNMLEILSLLR
jgi:hypothetical protein